MRRWWMARWLASETARARKMRSCVAMTSAASPSSTAAPSSQSGQRMAGRLSRSASSRA